VSVLLWPLTSVLFNPIISHISCSKADPGGRTVLGVRLRPLACWDCGFESHRVGECLSLMSVVCCQVEVTVSSWSLVQRSLTECGVSERDREASIMRRPWLTRGCCAMQKYPARQHLELCSFLKMRDRAADIHEMSSYTISSVVL
jgi:hypothetical protein